MISEGMKSNSTLTSLNLEGEEEKQKEERRQIKRRRNIDKKKKQERIKCKQGMKQEQKELK